MDISDYYVGAPKTREELMALPVATERDVAAPWAAWEPSGEGWLPWRGPDGWTRRRIAP